MSARGTADIVFCLDASASMQPCFDGVRRHVEAFVSGLQSNRQFQWDWRIDFVAHCAGEEQGQAAFHTQSLYNDSLWMALYHRSAQAGKYFTRNVEEFRRGLEKIQVHGDEAPLVALDQCLDLPWRDAEGCHRVVVLMSDEPAETGVFVNEQRRQLDRLIDKIQRLKVLLFLVAPDSDIFSRLAQADKSEYEVVDLAGDGLAKVDFRQVLSSIGKSVSVSTQQAGPRMPVERGLFGQSAWTALDIQIRGA